MLKDKTVFVTGSSRGIGAAIARLARKYGAQVILHGQSESEALFRMAKELDSPYVTFDVADEAVSDIVMADIGNVDILINNAGINPSKTFFELGNSDWQKIYGVNLFGQVNVIRPVLRRMVEKGRGSIVNIASIKGFTHIPGKPGYASSKAALIQLSAKLAEEFAPHGIRVNVVAPGFTNTEMVSATLSPKVQAQIDSIPIKRMATPEEIAEAVLFLASDRASYITGQCLAVDGGLSVV